MTDKEKIKNIIELFIAWNGETEAIDIANLDSAVDFIADSLQEESVSEVWHDVTEKPNTKRFVVLTKDGMITTAFIPLKMSFGELAERARIKKWAYLDDLVNLSNVERTVKNSQEPVTPKVLEDMLNAKTAAESLGISQEEHDRIVDELIYGKDSRLVDDLPNKGEEPISNDLEEAEKEWLTPQLDKSYADYGETKMMELTRFDGYAMLDAIEFGTQWQKEQDKETIELAEDHAMLAGMEKMKEQMMANIWKPANGDDLPKINREVIALLNNGKVIFAHRPYKRKYIGKNLTTGKIKTFENETYGEGGWNIPDIKWWLDVELPKEIEL